MIKSLYLDNCFRHFDRSITFDNGLTAIIGPNESGKSLTLEMIRYAFFGSKALRGIADDYKKLHVAMSFEIRGVEYKVVRKGNRADLYRGDEHIATGTKPVNAAIVRILGYDLQVFDTAHACNQGQVEALGAMTPADRKAMVDQTVGLTEMDAVEATVAEKARTNRALLQQAEADLGPEPVEPPKPVNYIPAADLRAARDQLRAATERFNQLQGYLSHRLPTAPIEPTCDITETADQIKLFVDLRQTVTTKQSQLKAQIDFTPTSPYTAEQLATFRAQLAAWKNWQEREKFTWRPTYTHTQLNEMELGWAAIETNNRRAELQHQLDHANKLECPKCAHSWPMDQAGVARIQAELEQLPPAVVLTPPKLTPTQIRQERFDLDNYGPKWERLKDVPEAPAPEISEAELIRLESLSGNREKIDMWKAELATLTLPPDRTEDYHKRRAYERDMVTYQTARRGYDKAVAERAERQAEFDKLSGVPDHYQTILEAYSAAEAYERELAAYQAARAKWDATAETVAVLRERTEQYSRAREALKELRARVKQYLVPSLSKVASNLLSQMTGGQRTIIDIDEDFNVLVDGQRLETLSGSGKAVANLAIRLGLGQVLTYRALSLFMGDEIDASMDNDRANFTAECFRNLSKSVKQVFLVSHKRPEADHYIDLAA
jgi:DNA repair exonuclease SbcCD ATPase subunit